MITRVGLTGGIACGKSVVGQRLKEHGIPVLDTDRVAHDLMRSGTVVFHRVLWRFGDGVLGADGELSRPALGRVVFADPSAREELNRIVHPAVVQHMKAWLRKKQGKLAVVAIPLLFECGLENEFDGVLVVGASDELMIARLLDRGLSPEQAALRIHAQWPVDRKLKLATWTLLNDGTLVELHEQIDAWVRLIQL